MFTSLVTWCTLRRPCCRVTMCLWGSTWTAVWPPWTRTPILSPDTPSSATMGERLCILCFYCPVKRWTSVFMNVTPVPVCCHIRCLTDPKLTAGAKSYFMQRSQEDKLNFLLKAFRFHQDHRNSVSTASARCVFAHFIYLLFLNLPIMYHPQTFDS